jgi:putative ABC transport system permease protein
MDTLWQDIKYGARMLAKSPGFTLVAVLTLALGIGANTAIFSLTDQILLRPLPVPNPEQLVVVNSPGPGSGRYSCDSDCSYSFSYPMFKGLRERGGDVVDFFGRFGVSMDVAVDGKAERAEGELVTGNYFTALQVPPAMGRVFTMEDEGASGSNPVAVLSHAYWQRRFGGSPAVLNKVVTINATNITIVGVAAPWFHGVQIGQYTDVFVPMSMKPMMTKNWDGLPNWNHYWMAILGRIKPGVSREQAQSALAAIYKPLLEEQLAQLRVDWSAETRQKFLSKPLNLNPGAGGRPILQSDAGDGLVMMTIMVGLVLLIACANVANLLVARGVARQRELAVRLAIGASRWRLVRQLLSESVLLALAGGAAGLLVAFWTVDALLAALSANLDVQGLTSNLDGRILGFNLALALLTGLIFGLLPSLQTTRPALAGTLKDQGAGATGGRSHTRFRKGLVVTQIAMTLLLLVGAGLFAKSFYALKKNDLGLRPENILAFSIAPEQGGYTPEQTRGFLDQLLPALRNLPGVTSAATVREPILVGSTSQSNFTSDSYQAKDEEYLHAVTNWVSPGYFSTLGIPLITGRDFAAPDGPGAQKVVIVNEFMAKHYYPNGAVGRKLAFGSGNDVKFEYEVIGVVADSKQAQSKEEPRPFAYMPYAQLDNLGRATFYLRTAGAPTALANAVRREVQKLDANLPVYNLRTLENVIERSLFAEELLMTLTVSFGVLAAALAALGIAGVMTYAVARRTREIGIRIALGAGAGHVHWLVLREVSVMAIFGAAVGLPLAYYLGKLARSLLFGVQEGDPWIALGALALMGMVAAFSGFLPARRAARIDPMVALRYE